MVKFIVIVLLVLIDIFNAIKYRNEQQQTRNSITEAKMCWLSAKESGNVANKRIDALKRALNEQAISTDYISVERLKEPEEVRPNDKPYTSNN